VRLVALAVPVAVAVMLAACSGGSGRLSNRELANRAAKICTQQAATIAQIPRGPANALNAVGYLGAVLSVVETGVKQFHKLRPPADQDAAYHAFLRELDRNVDILRTLRGAAAARQRKDYVVGLADLHRSRVRIDRLERQLGFRGCAGSSST
jgi:hypothetical protein